MEYKIIDMIKDLEKFSPRNNEEFLNNASKYIKENLEKVGIDFLINILKFLYPLTKDHIYY